MGMMDFFMAGKSIKHVHQENQLHSHYKSDRTQWLCQMLFAVYVHLSLTVKKLFD